jgi:hypothetical protein
MECPINRFFVINEIERLTMWVRDWNTDGRYAYVAQWVLELLLHILFNRINAIESNDEEPRKIDKEWVEAVQIYTERHVKKCNDMIKEMYLLEYTLQRM